MFQPTVIGSSPPRVFLQIDAQQHVLAVGDGHTIVVTSSSVRDGMRQKTADSDVTERNAAA